MNELFNNILSSTSSSLSVEGTLATMATSIIFGLAIGFTYFKTQKENYQQSFCLTLLMLPIILSVIILFVGSNVARAFSLAGTLSIVRFRSAPGDPKDIGFVFFAIASGLACGVGLYGYGAMFVGILCMVILLSDKIRLFEKTQPKRILKITIPESLSYENAFKDIFAEYTKSFSLTKIKTTDLGSLFELEYIITPKEGFCEQEFLNELRCRNGNLNIILSVCSAQ